MSELFITISAAVLVLGILIFVHELGHFLVAKACGVRVIRFSIGFGPLIVSRTVGETEYALSWIPLGGYVKMLGEDEGEEEGVPADPERSFASQSLFRRFSIVFAGPFFNLAFAWLCLLVMILGYGTMVPSAEPVVGGLVEDRPAAAAGIEPGDRIVALNGEAITGWENLAERIQESGGETVTAQVEREGETLTLSLTPERVPDQNIFGEEVGESFRIGIERMIESKHVGVFEAPVMAAQQTYFYSELIVLAVAKMVQGKISTRELGGPITIARVAGDRAQSGMQGLLQFMAFLGVNLAILNLLPIPVLDGGHLFFMAIEAVTRRPLEGRVREIAQQVGIVLLVSIMLFAIYNDIYRWVQG